MPSVALADEDCVVLLHGLARTSSSMKPLQRALTDAGYRVANVDYPSRDKKIEELAPHAVETGVKRCADLGSTTVHFVTHSLGGILVRYYMANNQLAELGNVVMIAPPNQGSEVVDNWRDIPGYKAINGPAGMQLGTDASSVPLSLGPVSFTLGVIAGNKTFNPMLSLSLPNPDDGKVSVAKTKVEGMTDFIEMPHTHTFIMRSDDVIRQTIHFLQNGRFQHDAP